MNADPTTAAAPRITSIVNCYGAAGANRCQIVVRADGSVTLLGDEPELGKAALLALRSFDLRKLGNRRAA